MNDAGSQNAPPQKTKRTFKRMLDDSIQWSRTITVVFQEYLHFIWLRRPTNKITKREYAGRNTGNGRQPGLKTNLLENTITVLFQKMPLGCSRLPRALNASDSDFIPQPSKALREWITNAFFYFQINSFIHFHDENETNTKKQTQEVIYLTSSIVWILKKSLLLF